jgi:glycerophosphoryl diester phosphodiesterase
MQSLIHLGYRVYVRTANNRKAMLRLVKGGVSGIFTDFPQVLRSVLNDYLPEKA